MRHTATRCFILVVIIKFWFFKNLLSYFRETIPETISGNYTNQILLILFASFSISSSVARGQLATLK